MKPADTESVDGAPSKYSVDAFASKELLLTAQKSYSPNVRRASTRKLFQEGRETERMAHLLALDQRPVSLKLNIFGGGQKEEKAPEVGEEEPQLVTIMSSILSEVSSVEAGWGAASADPPQRDDNMRGSPDASQTHLRLEKIGASL